MHAESAVGKAVPIAKPLRPYQKPAKRIFKGGKDNKVSGMPRTKSPQSPAR